MHRRGELVELKSDAKASKGESKIYEGIKCPISNAIMQDPVMTTDGHSYERCEIEKWLEKGNKISPMTGAPLLSTVLFPNHNLRMVIDEFKSRFPWLKPTQLKSPITMIASVDPHFSIQERNFNPRKNLLGSAINLSKDNKCATRDHIPETPIDAITIISDPLRLTSKEIPLFNFKAMEIETHFSGPTIGLTSVDPSTFLRELTDLVDDNSWFIDGTGWIHSPGGHTRICNWNPASIKKFDDIVVRASEEGNFQIIVNGILKVDSKLDIPVSDHTTNFWGFICLAGVLAGIKLLAPIDVSF